MPKFRATVRLSDLEGRDPAAVQQVIDERLKKSGFERWRVLGIQAEALPKQTPIAAHASDVEAAARRPSGGGLLLVAAAAWAIWFFWFLTE